MKQWKWRLVRMPVVGKVVLFNYRLLYALGYFKQPLVDLIRWLYTSRESTNFTYDLVPRNKTYLASTISAVLGISEDKVVEYIDELESDTDLKAHIAKVVESSDWGFMADRKVNFGRRVGWYAFARAMKPAIIVETGVDKGLGACLLAAALKRNHREGYPGRYYGTDINPRAGYLLSGPYAAFGEILYGDSLKSLQSFNRPIDLFINDSDHSVSYEAAEYDVVKDKLSANAVILGDNAHVTDELHRFSIRMGRRFVYFHEQPLRHWYPGGGIGISYNASPGFRASRPSVAATMSS